MREGLCSFSDGLSSQTQLGIEATVGAVWGSDQAGRSCPGTRERGGFSAGAGSMQRIFICPLHSGFCRYTTFWHDRQCVRGRNEKYIFVPVQKRKAVTGTSAKAARAEVSHRCLFFDVSSFLSVPFSYGYASERVKHLHNGEFPAGFLNPMS